MIAPRASDEVPTELSNLAEGEIASKPDPKTGAAKPMNAVYEIIIPVDNSDPRARAGPPRLRQDRRRHLHARLVAGAVVEQGVQLPALIPRSQREACRAELASPRALSRPTWGPRAPRRRSSGSARNSAMPLVGDADRGAGAGRARRPARGDAAACREGLACAACRPGCAAAAFRALRRWAAREAEVLAPEVVSGTVRLLATRSAIRAGPLGEPRPITRRRGRGGTRRRSGSRSRVVE